MAEEEANHRRRLENELVQGQFFEARRYRLAELLGMIFAFLIGVFGLSCATYCAVHGAQIAGSVIGAGGIGGLVTAFIMGRTLFMRQRKQDAELSMEQAKQLQQISELQKGP